MTTAVSDLIMQYFTTWLVWTLGVMVLIFWSRLLVRNSHICFNRYDMALIAIAVFGLIAFDTTLIYLENLCGGLVEPCANLYVLSAVSRVMRVVVLVNLLLVGHSAALRQRNVRKIVQEAGLNGVELD